MGRHRDFVMGIKADEFKRGFAGSIDDPSDVAVGDAHKGVATAIAATGATELQVLFPVLCCQCGLRLAANFGKEKSTAKFLATSAKILYTLGFMGGSHATKPRAPKMMLGFIVRRCAADIGHPPTPDEFAAWANGENQNGEGYCLFGKPISSAIAQLMFRQPGRLVTVRPGGLARHVSRNGQ
jgi:hypothetical protein